MKEDGRRDHTIERIKGGGEGHCELANGGGGDAVL